MTEHRFVNGSEPEGDPILVETMARLDPGYDDAGYWLRLRRTVMASVSRELARRRMVVELTVGDVLASWARTVVPTAALAAALAAILLLQPSNLTGPGSIGVEELLVEGLELEALPGSQVFESGEDDLVVILAFDF